MTAPGVKKFVKYELYQFSRDPIAKKVAE